MVAFEKRIILVDLNGTLVPEDAKSSKLPSGMLRELKAIQGTLRRQGYKLGLCSDSPLPELQKVADNLGLNDMIVAENGNLLFEHGRTTILRNLSDRQQYIMEITKILNGMRSSPLLNVVSPEFEGRSPVYEKGEWGFGAHRQTSVAVFAPELFIMVLQEHFAKITRLAGCIDCNPDYNYFAIHPIAYQQGKSLTLMGLQQQGVQVIMIGNSVSDWIDTSSRVKCAFVNDLRLPDNITRNAYYCSPYKTAKGVIDILRHIANDATLA